MVADGVGLLGNGSKAEFSCCPIDPDTGCPVPCGEVTPLEYPY